MGNTKKQEFEERENGLSEDEPGFITVIADTWRFSVNGPEVVLTFGEQVFADGSVERKKVRIQLQTDLAKASAEAILQQINAQETNRAKITNEIDREIAKQGDNSE